MLLRSSLDDEDSLVYETTRVVVHKNFIVAYRTLVTSGDGKPLEEDTHIHVADVTSMTAALCPTSSVDSVGSAISTPSGTPNALQPSISVDPNRRLRVPP